MASSAVGALVTALRVLVVNAFEKGIPPGQTRAGFVLPPAISNRHDPLGAAERGGVVGQLVHAHELDPDPVVVVVELGASGSDGGRDGSVVGGEHACVEELSGSPELVGSKYASRPNRRAFSSGASGARSCGISERVTVAASAWPNPPGWRRVLRRRGRIPGCSRTSEHRFERELCPQRVTVQSRLLGLLRSLVRGGTRDTRTCAGRCGTADSGTRDGQGQREEEHAERGGNSVSGSLCPRGPSTKGTVIASAECHRCGMNGSQSSAAAWSDARSFTWALARRSVAAILLEAEPGLALGASERIPASCIRALRLPSGRARDPPDPAVPATLRAELQDESGCRRGVAGRCFRRAARRSGRRSRSWPKMRASTGSRRTPRPIGSPDRHRGVWSRIRSHSSTPWRAQRRWEGPS